MLTLAMPQSEPAADRNARPRRGPGEDRRRQPLRRRRSAARSPRELAVGHARRGSARRSRATSGRPARACSTSAGRTYWPPAPTATALAAMDRAARRRRPRRARAHARRRRRVDQRPHQHAVGSRIADRHRPRRRAAGARAAPARRDSCTISRRSVVQRWPAVPMAAANTIARTARSRSALGATIIALLPPSSSKRAAEARRHLRVPTTRPIAVSRSPTPARRGDRRRAPRRSRRRRAPRSTGRAARRRSGDRAVEQRLRRERRQRRLLRGLPQTRVAADQRQRGVPRPHRDREVERRDDADHAERVPGSIMRWRGRSVAIVRP
jgi:hypothetical protein